jgi:DNA-binding CsgD family transcriptional regulator
MALAGEGAIGLVEVSLAHVARLALQTGLGLLLATAAIGSAVLIGEGGSPLLVVEGLGIVGASAVLIVQVGAAARLLRRRGAVWVAVVLFSALGAIEHRLQLNLSNVLIAAVWIAAVVGPTSSVLVTVVLAWVGYMADVLLEPSALRAANGSLLSQGVGELVILIISAGLTATAIRILRATLADAPNRIAEARSGTAVPSGLGRLAAAVGSDARASLPRGDSAAIVACLSAREREVLDLLAQGLAPKQIAGRSFVALATVRSRIASAKRKTGARTLDQLVGLYAEAMRDA